MEQKSIYAGDQLLFNNLEELKGELIEYNGEEFYKLSNVDNMQAFFMSLVSPSNHWMFISSTGGLTAGRTNSDHALFPYYTDDRITESFEHTGSKTIIRVLLKDRVKLWIPFSDRYKGTYKISRNLYKNSYGNKLVFEEVNHDLAMTYSYEWNTTDRYGFVRKSRLENNSTDTRIVQVLDGVQNILPSGVGEKLQQAYSNLVDAYKRTELYEDHNIATIALSAVIVDKAEPSEALRANIAWSYGINSKQTLLSASQIDRFIRHGEVQTEYDVKAHRGAYLSVFDLQMDAGTSSSWGMVLDLDKDIKQVVNLSEDINSAGIEQRLLDDIQEGQTELLALVGEADGLQLTADALMDNRHFANTMFNIMRGGIFDHHYQVEKRDFIEYLKKANSAVYDRHVQVLLDLPDVINYTDLIADLGASDDSHLNRLTREYLPLKFSRRHGDPSRPWNKFSINTKNPEDGSKILDYQGNWRDLFQNWEALAFSYPGFMEGMINKFLNASTFDGYNPYRVTKGGFDWEVIEEDDPWSYIGYWGDHQIIYLLKFLEFIEKYQPGALKNKIGDKSFVYANVPYRIKPYTSILANPKDTIDFEHDRQHLIEKRRESLGTDGALLVNKANEIHQVDFIEKILATTLAKLSNYIPEAGIWMNTQRPEWNDANNALVGNGVSMVTLYYLRRFFNYLEHFFKDLTIEVELSLELADFYHNTASIFNTHIPDEGYTYTNKSRKQLVDALGNAGSIYREAIYDQSFSGDYTTVSTADLYDFSKNVLSHLDHCIAANKRNDNLYHAYNLITIESDSIAVAYLSEMLEGQVAVLSAGCLNATDSLKVLKALRNSALYREDQNSYILYPNKNLLGFATKNNIPSEWVKENELLQHMISTSDERIITKDARGNIHFNGGFYNATYLENALNSIAEEIDITPDDRTHILELYERVFDHKSFTGRSGTFFGYEGLGSIYWHMVSKLGLAVQEVYWKAVETNQSQEVLSELKYYHEHIQDGIGVHKSPKVYGAIPTDPYSHTPGHKGAQQPGMTGQVKEDVIVRFGNLGVQVNNGAMSFNPQLISSKEWLLEDQIFQYVDVLGNWVDLFVQKGSIVFTIAQVPVVYTKGDDSIQIYYMDGRTELITGLSLNSDLTTDLLSRDGVIDKIQVQFNF